jgi:transcriptional regulator with XRE-family HTH domain
MQVDHDEVAVAKLIGSRMAEARMLCKLPIHIAADRMDVSAQWLEQLENGIDATAIPLKTIRRASLIYDVSTDFLLAFSDDWEVAEETKMGREIGAWIYHEQEKLFAQWAAKQMRMERQVEAMAAMVAVLPAEIEAVGEALNAFKQMNTDFDKLPAGSMLQFRIRRAHEKAQEARCALVRHKVIPA